MALFNGDTRQEGSRSSTALVKSGHASPAEKWLLDPVFKTKEMSGVFKDGVLFNYQYGGPGMQDVTIPKGRMVGAGTPVKDFSSNKYLTTLTLPGLSVANNTIGMAPYNFNKDWTQSDRFGGNQPSIITMDYVELPVIPGFKASTAYTKDGVLEEELEFSVNNRNPWGAVVGQVNVGDYVKSTPSGRLCKWDSTKDSPMDVVGQILAVDFNFETEGWMKWVLWEEQYRKDDDAFVNRSGVSNLPSDNGYPYDPTYPEGNTIFQNYQSELIDNPTGIVGLHDGSGNYDGFGRNDTVYEKMKIGTILSGTKADTILQLQAVDYAGGKMENIMQGVQVFIDDVQVAADKIHISYKNGIIQLTVPADATADQVVTATYQARHYGTPTWMDFKGVVGAAFILLKK